MNSSDRTGGHSHDTGGHSSHGTGGHSHDAGGHCFDDAAATWDENPAKVERARAAAARIRQAITLSPDDRVLDIGGGTGQLVLHLADDIGSATVADSSAGMVEAARRNFESRGIADRFAAEQLDITADDNAVEPASYDGACSQLALHHIDDVPLLLRRLKAALRPGGWIALIDLDVDPHGGFHQHNPDFEGHHGFDRSQFQRDLEAAGFTDVHIGDGGAVDKELDGQLRPFPLFLATARA